MAINGPEDVRIVLSKYSNTECQLYMALSHAKEDEDAEKEAEIKQQIAQANIPDFINRYLQFAQDLLAISKFIQASDEKIAQLQNEEKLRKERINQLLAGYMDHIEANADSYISAYSNGFSGSPSSSSSSSHQQTFNPSYTPSHSAQRTNGSSPSQAQEPTAPKREIKVHFDKKGRPVTMKPDNKNTCTIC